MPARLAVALSLLFGLCFSSRISAGEVTFDEPQSPVFEKALPESVSDLKTIQDRVQKLAGPLSEVTVGLQIGRAQGSGVIVSGDGYILTAAHVSGTPGQNVTVILHDGKRATGTTLGLNRAIDAGLVKLNGERTDWPHASLGKSDDVSVGDWVLAFGHPRGYIRGRPPVLRLGRVILTRSTVLQSGCKLVGGDSGGPLFDLAGRVIAIHSKIGATSAWNFHVPVSAYSEDWERLAASEEWSGLPGQGGENTAILGVMGRDADPGVEVTSTTESLPAFKAGLREGDMILRFDGRRVRTFDSLYRAVGRKKPGDEVVIEFRRGEETRRVTVTLADRAAARRE